MAKECKCINPKLQPETRRCGKCDMFIGKSEHILLNDENMKEEDKKLLLKALCMYLPYKLRIDLLSQRYVLGGIVNNPLYHDYFLKHDFRNEEFWSGDSTKYIKPLLLPLSALTEEDIKKIIGHEDDGTMGMWINNIHAVFMKFDHSIRIQEELIKRHYDIYGLIEKGLAIDKRTIK